MRERRKNNSHFRAIVLEKVNVKNKVCEKIGTNSTQGSTRVDSPTCQRHTTCQQWGFADFSREPMMDQKMDISCTKIVPQNRLENRIEETALMASCNLRANSEHHDVVVVGAYVQCTCETLLFTISVQSPNAESQ